MAGPLLTDGINLGARLGTPREEVQPPEDEGHNSGHVGDENADPTGSEDSEGGQGPGEGDSPANGESVPLEERLADMTIPEIEKAIEEGEFTAQEAADTEATFDEPRVGVLSLGTN